jgi:hypothetical protein
MKLNFDYCLFTINDLTNGQTHIANNKKSHTTAFYATCGLSDISNVISLNNCGFDGYDNNVYARTTAYDDRNNILDCPYTPDNTRLLPTSTAVYNDYNRPLMINNYDLAGNNFDFQNCYFINSQG